jgi:hypothetical protein
LPYRTNGSLLGGGKPVLTGPTIVDKTNIDQIAKFASADTRVPSQVERILPGTDEPYGSLFPIGEEGGAADLGSRGRRGGCSPRWLRRPSSHAASGDRSLT